MLKMLDNTMRHGANISRTPFWKSSLNVMMIFLTMDFPYDNQ